MMTTLPTAFAALAKYSQFVVYKLVPSTKKPGKMEKYPLDWRTGQLPPKGEGGAAIWTDADTAGAIASMLGPDHGVGFSFAESDPFWFLDIDGCLQKDGSWSPLAIDLCTQLHGVAIEISQSGTGLHLIGSGIVPAHGCTNKALGLEFYTSGRFVALTGTGAMGDAAANKSDAISRIVTTYFPPSVLVTPDEWTSTPSDDWKGPVDDDELIRRILASRPSVAASFGGKASVIDLWEANETALSVSYPDPTRADGGTYGKNEADAALATHLAWWTGRDMERMRRLMDRSALRRDKWLRDDYMVRTIQRACAMTNPSYRERSIDMPPPPADPALGESTLDKNAAPTVARIISDNTYLTPSDQIVVFDKCVYVRDVNKILVPGGSLLDQQRFDATFGRFTFSIDNENSKTAKGAWDAFLHSKAVDFPKAHTSCFRPELPPACLFTEADRQIVNTWAPIATDSAPGDAGPFIEHLRKLLPDNRDRAILTAYLAALVQHKGDKFQWAPLIQGVEGNGKSLILACLESAIGDRYTHRPNASDIGGNGGKFTGWMLNKLLIGVEEIKSNHRAELLEIMKPWLTNSRLEIQSKGADQVTGDNRANFLLFSNHRDAITKTARDRRYAIFYTAQQEPEHLARDGMDGDYFPKLYTWLRNGGFAVVNHWLRTYQIPAELNPALANGGLATRAPKTTSTEEAVALSLGRVEQEVMEAVAQGRYGFAGGWIASTELDELLRDRKLDGAVARNKRASMLETLGYVHHPHLYGGRATTPVAGGARPILYVRKDGIPCNLDGGEAISRAYDAAQVATAGGVTGFAKRAG